MLYVDDVDDSESEQRIDRDVPEVRVVSVNRTASDRQTAPTSLPVGKSVVVYSSPNGETTQKAVTDISDVETVVERRLGKAAVYVQVVFIKLGEIDTVKETFTADVFIQARWREPRLDGSHKANNQNPDAIKFDKYWNPKLYVDNTVGEPKETIGHTVVYDTNTWEAFVMERRRIKGAFLENLELFQFPFDTQELTIKVMSELTSDQVSLESDPKHCSTINVESFVDEQEWRLYNEVETLSDIENKVYQGDTAENSFHPFFKCKTHASRRCGFYVTNILLVMCFICSMAFCSFSVDYMKRENRLQLTFILLLTTVTFKFAVNSSLPRISYLTNLDIYIMTSMTILIIVCVWHAIVPFIHFDWGQDAARKSDMAIVIALGVSYVLVQIIYALCIGIPATLRKNIFLEKERVHMRMLKKEKKSRADDAGHGLQDIRQASSAAAAACRSSVS